jgi:hypothetical protein
VFSTLRLLQLTRELVHGCDECIAQARARQPVSRSS